MKHDFPFDDLDDRILARFLAGHGAPEDDAYIQEWLNDDPLRRRYLDEVAEVWRRSPDALVEGDANSVWTMITRRVGVAPVARPPAARVHRKWAPKFTAGVTLAAACVIAIGFGFRELSERAGAVGTHANEHALFRELTTATGQRATITLGDGSQVTLAPASRMRYVVDPQTGVRRVVLQGAALFSVRQNTARGFIVQTHTGTTSVLGTTFVVRGYDTDSATTVAVQDGRVMVSSITEQGDIILDAGDVANIPATGAAHRLTHVTPESFMAWTAGRLTFSNATAVEVARELERWFDVDIEVDPSLPVRHITASVDIASLSETLEILAPALNATVRRSGQQIVLYAH